MESITAAEIYVFYQRNKKTFKTQHDLVRGFLAEKLDISSTNKSKEVKIIFGQEVDKLVSSLRKILVNARSSKMTTTLGQIIFMPSDKCIFLLERMEQNESEDSSNST